LLSLPPEPAQLDRVWRLEHKAILRHGLVGDAAQAETAASAHAANAARQAAEQLQSEAA
jgi:DNA-binding GntR family transcriptional regulator